MTFGKLLYAMIKSRGNSLRGYSALVDMDSGNLCKLVNSQMAPPKSPRHVWGLIGPLNPTSDEVNELMCAAHAEHAERLKKKWMIL